jgi:hypothetical protein
MCESVWQGHPNDKMLPGGLENFAFAVNRSIDCSSLQPRS